MDNELGSYPHLSGSVIRYGIYGLGNACLRSCFYPDDLPEDWRLEYYSHEFRVILTTFDELVKKTGLNKNSVIAMCSDIRHIVAELDEDFILLIELAADIPDIFSPDELRELEKTSLAVKNLHFIRHAVFARPVNEAVKTGVSLFELEMLFDRDRMAMAGSRSLLIKESGRLTPLALRQTLEYCTRWAGQKGELWLLFASREHALENCRNAVLMDSLM